MSLKKTLGIIGGTGQLGSAMATAWLESGCLAPDSLWISNRTGNSAGFDTWPDITFTNSNQALADACDIIVLSVPPALIESVRIEARGKLVFSVMAGVSLEALSDLTGSSRVIRAMSSPAARQRLAYSPWTAPDGLPGPDREAVNTLLSACGLSDEVQDERQIEVFTALTGPVPGFAAFFADAMVRYALANGVAPEIAVRAVKQLFLASGQIMSADAISPEDRVKEMIDYAGTTASGLVRMQELDLPRLIAEGFEASTARVRTIAGGD
ncbi:pyrroline-5-carboxylate reductase family protein [Roseibium sediminicola]|uniref:NAD(P)-binding domain-containing protein n=1 Tax=Roseibium sediminicola TaxID=2933272 RepID=A0ABT0GQ18_9HYPH|nr:pyrroline-5-carboxylate reductase dimerization domain-containing protein [Roseibium sp. CAU 1639]MCK7610960.1 NAD(P)-binding domain-containing protein [Roseibium sp. CAU 1639]